MLLTRPPLRILIKNQNSPFDLHVLSVPPAFVLSQDQTLYYSCISRIFRFVEINPVHNACVITSCVLFFSLYLTSCFLQIFIQRNLKGRYFFLHCSIFKMLRCLLTVHYFVTSGIRASRNSFKFHSLCLSLTFHLVVTAT